MLSDAQIQQYAEDGFLMVRGVFSSFEMALLAIESEKLLENKHLIDAKNIRCRWQNHVDTDECMFDAFDPVIDLSPVCEQLARDPRLTDIVSALYEEPARLFKDKLIFKRPGARGYDLHQDYISWPSFPKSFVTAAVAIDPCGEGNGCTEVFAGYHKEGYLSPRDGEYHSIPAERVDESRRVCLELEPGDVAIFTGFTPHRSGRQSIQPMEATAVPELQRRLRWRRLPRRPLRRVPHLAESRNMPNMARPDAYYR